jgi:hopanoid-associated phosphorylase
LSFSRALAEIETRHCAIAGLQRAREAKLAAVIGVAGLAFEARIACGAHTRVICAGDGHGLETSLSHAIAGDARGLISFGIAGGLSPNLQPGTCIVASSIVCGTRRLMTDNAWSRNALRLIPDAVPGTIAGVSGVVAAHPATKCALHEQTGAIAVDNESHVVARVAAAYGLPMIAVRVIVDPVSREIPASAVAAVRADGSIDLAALGRRIGGAPGELPKLLRIAIDGMTGFLALLRCRRLLGSALGLPSLAENDTNTRPTREITGPTICGLRDEYLEGT